MPPAVPPVLFFPGPEVGRKRERIASIAQALEERHGEAPETHRFYPYDTDMSEVLSLLRNGSLFSSQRLVVLADAHALKAAEIRAFKEYIASPSDEAVLIFTTDETPGTRAYPRTLADALPKSAVQVFWEMFERDKRGWVMKFFRDRKRAIDPAAVDLLLDVTAGTTDALKEACELLAFSRDASGSIGEDDVEDVLEHGRDETIYSLFDRFCRRDLSGVLDSYRTMLHSDPSAVDRALSMMADPLSRLRDFAVLSARGLGAEDAAREIKLRGGKRAIRAYAEGARCYTPDELSAALRGLIDLEAWLRTAPRELRSPKTELWLCGVIGRS